MRVFGLTGGIGTGKSTVAGLLRARGVPVIDADQVAREVVAPGSDGLAAIVEAFGPGALNADGSLDRPAMRARIMADASARATLEAITHPRIGARIGEQLAELAQSGCTLAGVEAALMVETGTAARYERLVVVNAPPEVQLARVVARDHVTPEQAASVLAAQWPMARKLALAHHVVQNDGGLDALAREVDQLLTELRG